jgi:hypothetical protein
MGRELRVAVRGPAGADFRKLVAVEPVPITPTRAPSSDTS